MAYGESNRHVTDCHVIRKGQGLHPPTCLGLNILKNNWRDAI